MNLKQAKAALALGLKVRMIHWKYNQYAYVQDGLVYMWIQHNWTHEPLHLGGYGFINSEWEIFNELQSSKDNAIDNG